jgi:membrane-associated protease RseP (regulator of RpoE activity)
MSYEPPPLEPELLELESEIRQLRPMAPDIAMTQRFMDAMRQPFAESEASVISILPAPAGQRKVVAFPWRRYAPAAAAAAAVLGIAAPSFLPDNAADDENRPPVAANHDDAAAPSRERSSVIIIPGRTAQRPSHVRPADAELAPEGEDGIFVPNPPEDAIPEATSPYGFIGLRVSRLAAGVRAQLDHLDIPKEAGIGIDRVVLNSPAHLAGLSVYDIIVSVDGEPVKDMWQFAEIIRKNPPGTEVRVGIVRGGRQESVVVKLIPAPSA